MTSILRQRMRDAMVLSGKAARAQEASIGAVFGLARYYHRSPDVLTAQRLPEILSRQELACLFAAAGHLKARTFLMLAYGSGLRLSELCRLRAEHIDSHAADHDPLSRGGHLVGRGAAPLRAALSVRAWPRHGSGPGLARHRRLPDRARCWTT